MQVVEVVQETFDEAIEREICWIRQRSSEGMPLVNKIHYKEVQTQQTTIYLEPEVSSWIRHRIADSREDISEVINLAVRRLMQS
jgi:hypothetical protein